MKQLIIIGGGNSIQEGIVLGLWEKLRNKFTMGINYSYKFFDSTFQTYVDAQFYNRENLNLEKLPLIIGSAYKINKKLPNTLSLTTSNTYVRDLSKGVYSPRLSGMFSLSLAIYLLDVGEIFLLGYDLGNTDESKDDKKRYLTHFYQGALEHNGVGKVNYYNGKGRAEQDFGVYKNEQKIHIYNVSLLSKINMFPKISYTEFFSKLDPETYDQNELRLLVREKLKSK